MNFTTLVIQIKIDGNPAGWTLKVPKEIADKYVKIREENPEMSQMVAFRLSKK